LTVFISVTFQFVLCWWPSWISDPQIKHKLCTGSRTQGISLLYNYSITCSF